MKIKDILSRIEKEKLTINILECKGKYYYEARDCKNVRIFSLTKSQFNKLKN